MLFDTFADTVWRPSCVKLRECTKVGYESALACHILPRWRGKDIDSITVADIESWLDSFDKPGAARKAYAVFRAILRLAFKRGLADNDVTRREIRLPHLRHGTKTGRLVGNLNANQVANHYRSWCKRMKLPCVPPRNLRHTFGTLAIKAGTDISVVARQLGHSDIQTTARYYLKPDLSVLKDMQKAWQKLILTS